VETIEEYEGARLSSLIFTKSKKLIGFYIRAINRPGTLSAIAKTFEKYKVNICAIVFSTRAKLGNIEGSFFVCDFTNLNVDPNVVKREIRKIKNVVEVKIDYPQLPQILADLHHFPIIDDFGRRLLLLTEDDMKLLAVLFKKKFGRLAAASLYHHGLDLGHLYAQDLKTLGIKDLKEALKAFLICCFARGICEGRIVYYSYRHLLRKDLIKIRIFKYWECELARKYEIMGPTGHIFRGIIAGLVEAYTGRKVKAKETSCVAKGDPYCEIKIEFQD